MGQWRPCNSSVPVALPVCAVEVPSDEVDAVFSHEDPDLKHQVEGDVGPLGALVVHVEAHDAERGVTIIWRPSEPGPRHDALKCPTCICPITGHKTRVNRDALCESVELLSRGARGRVGVRLSQRHHVPRSGKERPDVVGCVASWSWVPANNRHAGLLAQQVTGACVELVVNWCATTRQTLGEAWNWRTTCQRKGRSIISSLFVQVVHMLIIMPLFRGASKNMVIDCRGTIIGGITKGLVYLASS